MKNLNDMIYEAFPCCMNRAMFRTWLRHLADNE